MKLINILFGDPIVKEEAMGTTLARPVAKTIVDLHAESGLDFEKVKNILANVKTYDKYSSLGVDLGPNAMTADLVWLVYFRILILEIESLRESLSKKD